MESIQFVDSYLTTNNTLKDLNMSNNFITGVGVIKIAKAIQKTKH